MRRCIRGLAGLCWVLGASPAAAQPLPPYDWDWTAELGHRRYGLRARTPVPGEFRLPQVWIAGRLFQPADVPADAWVVAFPPVTAGIVLRYLSRTLRKSATVDH